MIAYMKIELSNNILLQSPLPIFKYLAVYRNGWLIKEDHTRTAAPIVLKPSGIY